MKNPDTNKFSAALKRNASVFGVKLGARELALLAAYYELLISWNPRLHLVAPCSPEEFAVRHVLESLLLLPHLQIKARVVDVGSGGGLPILPCLGVRSDIGATLVESSAKKTIFLREAVKSMGLEDRATVVAARFEDLSTPDANAITCRALDRFGAMLPRLIKWSPANSRILLFGGDSLATQIEAAGHSFAVEPVPASDRRRLFILGRS